MRRIVVNSTPLIVLSNIQQFLGLKVTGTLGVHLKAKQKKLIEKVEPLMNQMIADGFYISPEIYALAKSEAKE